MRLLALASRAQCGPGRPASSTLAFRPDTHERDRTRGPNVLRYPPAVFVSAPPGSPAARALPPTRPRSLPSFLPFCSFAVSGDPRSFALGVPRGTVNGGRGGRRDDGAALSAALPETVAARVRHRRGRGGGLFSFSLSSQPQLSGIARCRWGAAGSVTDTCTHTASGVLASSGGSILVLARALPLIFPGEEGGGEGQSELLRGSSESVAGERAQSIVRRGGIGSNNSHEVGSSSANVRRRSHPARKSTSTSAGLRYFPLETTPPAWIRFLLSPSLVLLPHPPNAIHISLPSFRHITQPRTRGLIRASDKPHESRLPRPRRPKYSAIIAQDVSRLGPVTNHARLRVISTRSLD